VDVADLVLLPVLVDLAVALSDLVDLAVESSNLVVVADFTVLVDLLDRTEVAEVLDPDLDMEDILPLPESPELFLFLTSCC